MRLRIAVAVASGLVIPSVGNGAPAKETPSSATEQHSPPQALDPAAKAAGLRLAEFIYDEDSQIVAATQMIDTALGPAFRSNENFQALERQYPGFIDAVLAELRPQMTRYARDVLPEYRQRAAEIYASHLTAAEIDDLHQFYRTPTGKKFIKGMTQDGSVDAVVAEALSDPDKPTTHSAMTKDHSASLAATKKLMDENDVPALVALGSKPYATRALKVGPEMRQLDLDMMNRPMPEFEKAIEETFERIIARFEAAANGKSK